MLLETGICYKKTAIRNSAGVGKSNIKNLETPCTDFQSPWNGLYEGSRRTRKSALGRPVWFFGSFSRPWNPWYKSEVARYSCFCFSESLWPFWRSFWGRFFNLSRVLFGKSKILALPFCELGLKAFSRNAAAGRAKAWLCGHFRQEGPARVW